LVAYSASYFAGSAIIGHNVYSESQSDALAA
jgi:hypothetical protein